MIDIEGLRFSYPARDAETFSLDIPRLAVDEGERVAVVGPSGSGKTTLLNLIAGIARPDDGAVRVAGLDVGALSDARRRAFRISSIGFVFQNFELIDYLSAFENILYPYRISPALRLSASVKARARSLAEAAGVADKLARRPAALSQGEKQRVAICRALTPQPKLILADEATGNLDPANKTAILDLLFERVAADGATLVAVTHDHALLPRFDRVVDFQSYRRRDAEGAARSEGARPSEGVAQSEGATTSEGART